MKYKQLSRCHKKAIRRYNRCTRKQRKYCWKKGRKVYISCKKRRTRGNKRKKSRRIIK